MPYQTKDELAEIARRDFGVELDLTQKHDVLVQQVQDLRNGAPSQEPEQPEEPPEPRATRQVYRHKQSGQIVGVGSPLLAKSNDLELVEVPVED